MLVRGGGRGSHAGSATASAAGGGYYPCWEIPPGCGSGDLPGVGLDPPPGKGLEIPLWPDPSTPPWVWAWRPARHAGILPSPSRPARHAGIPPAMHDGIPPPPTMNRMTDRHITFANFVCGRYKFYLKYIPTCVPCIA